jgi:hypothetical protein
MLMRRLLALLVPVLISLPAPAGMLYKSVSPNGTIVFSDVPPADGARVVEQRVISDTGMPRAAAAANTSPLVGVLEYDSEIARANAQVDLAEHALALARQGTWSPSDGMRIQSPRRSREDEQRIDYYRKGLIIARQQLMDVIGERRAGPTQVALR